MSPAPWLRRIPPLLAPLHIRSPAFSTCLWSKELNGRSWIIRTLCLLSRAAPDKESRIRGERAQLIFTYPQTQHLSDLGMLLVYFKFSSAPIQQPYPQILPSSSFRVLSSLQPAVSCSTSLSLCTGTLILFPQARKHSVFKFLTLLYYEWICPGRYLHQVETKLRHFCPWPSTLPLYPWPHCCQQGTFSLPKIYSPFLPALTLGLSP